jgi:predicted hydrocarbon binding protein
MESLSNRKFFLTNRYARIILGGYEETLGRDRLAQALSRAGLESWLAEYPPNDLDRGVDFASFSALDMALEETYGRRGGRGLAIRAGRAVVPELLHAFGVQMGVDQVAFKLLPLREKISAGLRALAFLFGEVSDQPAVVVEQADKFVFTLQRCAACWGREQADRPLCCLLTGILQEWVKWLAAGQDWPVAETRCIAMGDAVCEFEIPKTTV